MTSSLVGSEMCIRDSHIYGPALRRARGATGSPSDHHSPQTAPPPNAGTVSYTHLTLPTICSV
eukprot:6014125-Prorocentrum_lima.AAC.1